MEINEETEQTKGLVDIDDEEIDDVEFVGNNTLWKVLIKAWSDNEEWCDTTMAMELPGGVLVRTQYISEESTAEALQFIKGVRLERDSDDRWNIVS